MVTLRTVKGYENMLVREEYTHTYMERGLDYKNV